ncbi:MAG: Ig-like domain repeat protein [Firmicutes bacterium]|nr:Ig-like domain repeat protein [Bacillota bacterium]
MDNQPPQVTITEISPVLTDPAGSNTVVVNGAEAVVNPYQSLKIGYSLSDDTPSAPELVLELTNVATNEKVEIRKFNDGQVGSGLSRIWDGSDDQGRKLADGRYRLAFYAVDSSGNSSKRITAAGQISQILIDRTAPKLSAYALPLVVSSKAPTTTIHYTVEEALSGPLYLDVQVKSEDHPETAPEILLSNKRMDTLTATDSLEWTAAGKPNGTYKVEFEVRDSAANKATASASVVANTVLTRLTSPEKGAVVNGKIVLKGIAVDPDWQNSYGFARYMTYFRAGDVTPSTGTDGHLDLTGWSPIPVPYANQDPSDPLYPNSNVSVRPVPVEGTVADWDLSSPAIGDGPYTVLLVSEEEITRAYTFDILVVNVQKGMQVISPSLTLLLSGNVLEPGGAAPSDDTVFLTYILSQKDADVSVQIIRELGGKPGDIVRSFKDLGAPANGTARTFVWDGKDDLGAYAPTGQYLVVATAEALDGSGVDQKSLPLTVTTPLFIQLRTPSALTFNPYQAVGVNSVPVTAALTYSVSKDALTTAKVYKSDPRAGAAEIIKTLANELTNLGNRDYTLNWDGTSNANPSQIVSPGKYYVSIWATAGNQATENLVTIDLANTITSVGIDKVDLAIQGVDEDKNGVVETQGSSEFVYQASGSGKLMTFPDRNYDITVFANGKQRVKEYLKLSYDLSFDKWYERLDKFKANISVLWLSQYRYWGSNRTEEAHVRVGYTPEWAGLEWNKAANLYWSPSTNAWLPNGNFVRWGSGEVGAGNLIADRTFADEEFPYPNSPAQLVDRRIWSSTGVDLTDFLGAENWNPYYTREDSFAATSLDLRFNFWAHAHRQTGISGLVDYYHPITMQPDSPEGAANFDWRIRSSMSNFKFGPVTVTSGSQDRIDPSKILANGVNVGYYEPRPSEGRVYAHDMTTSAHIYRDDIMWPDPMSSVNLSPLTEFVDTNGNRERDSWERLVADYGGLGISKKYLAGKLRYGEEKQYIIFRKDTTGTDYLLDTSSQTHLLPGTLAATANDSDLPEKDYVITEAFAENGVYKLRLRYNPNVGDLIDWRTTQDPALLAANPAGKLLGRREFNRTSFGLSDEISLREDYPYEKQTPSDVPTNYTFLLNNGEKVVNPDLTLDNWRVDLFYLDGKPNQDLAIEGVNLAQHSFKVKLATSKPRSLAPLLGTVLGSNFDHYELYYYDNSSGAEAKWRPVEVPVTYQSQTNPNPFIAVGQITGVGDGIDNDRDGQVDEPGEPGVLGYLDVSGLNDIHTVLLRVYDRNGGVTNVTQAVQVGKAVLPTAATVVSAPYKMADLAIPAGAVSDTAIVTVTPTNLQNVDLANRPVVATLGPVVNMKPSGLSFSSAADGIDNDQDGQIDEPDEEKRPTLTIRIPYEAYPTMDLQGSGFNLYYLDGNGDLKALNTVFQWQDRDNNGKYSAGDIFEFQARVDHFSYYALLQDHKDYLLPQVEQITSPTNKPAVRVAGKASPQMSLEVYIDDDPFFSDSAEVLTPLRTVPSDSTGAFDFGAVNLAEGANHLFVKYAGVANSPLAMVKVVKDTVPPVVKNLADSPDPFSTVNGGISTISFEPSEDGKVYFMLYDAGGQLIQRSEHEVTGNKTNAIKWNGATAEGLPVADGVYRYQMFVMDKAGNTKAGDESLQGTITKDNVAPLLENLRVSSEVLSPNGDGIKEFATITFRVAELSQVVARIEDASGNVVKLLTQVNPQAVEEYQYLWDGTDQQGQIASDGGYRLGIEAVDLAGNKTKESIRIKVDTIAPQIVVSGVVDGVYYNQDLAPMVVIIEPNLASKLVKLNGQPFNRGMVVNMEGEYQLVGQVEDAGGNRAEVVVRFTLDKTPPTVSVTGVADGVFYNHEVAPQIAITDKYLDSSTILLNGQPYTSGTPVKDDGTYTLSIEARDQAGNVTARQVDFGVDKVPPVIKVSGVEDGGAYNVDVVPVVEIEEANLVKSRLTLNELPFKSGTTVHADDQYTLYITAEDRAGNTANRAVKFVIDQTPPLAPLWPEATPEDAAVLLSWYPNRESDLGGYNVYRDGVKVNSQLLTSTSFHDVGLINGREYAYNVTALDWLGNESLFSAAVKATPGLDVAVSPGDIILPVTAPYAGENVPLRVNVQNTGHAVVRNVAVYFYDGDPASGGKLIGKDLVAEVPLGGAAEARVAWETMQEERGVHHIYVWLDPSNLIHEIDETNNIAFQSITLAAPFEIGKGISARPRVLVWTENRENQDLATRALTEMKVFFTVVKSKEEFVAKLRSDQYNVFAILDTNQPLPDHFSEELLERVHKGDGLLISRWSHHHGDDLIGDDLEDLFQVDFEGFLPPKERTITLEASPLSGSMRLLTSGKLLKLEVDQEKHGEGEKVKDEKVKDEKDEAGEDHDKPGVTPILVGSVAEKKETYPAAVLSGYGQGKAVLFAFDLGTTRQESGADLAELLQSAIHYVTPSQLPEEFFVGDVLPVETRIKNLGVPVNLRVVETVPIDSTILQPLQGKVDQAGLFWESFLDTGVARDFGYIVRLPDRVYNEVFATEIQYLYKGAWRHYDRLEFPVVANRDAAQLLREIIAGMYTQSPVGEDYEHWKKALKELEELSREDLTRKRELEKAVHDLLKVVKEVNEMTQEHLELRLQLDKLLTMYEAKWFYTADAEEPDDQQTDEPEVDGQKVNKKEAKKEGIGSQQNVAQKAKSSGKEGDSK